jgi:uncharacterized protein YndB with AHSA1/START domain
MKIAIAALLLAPALALSAADAGAQERFIVKTVTVKASVDDAWNAWTTTEGIKSFFAPDARVEARPGGPFEVYMNPYARPGLKGADGMVVLAVQEKKLISFTWNAPPHLAEARKQRTAVAVRFKPAGEGLTEVRLTHTGWGEGGEWDQAYDYFDKAWGRVLENLGKRFAEGPVDWAPFLARVKAYQDAEDAKAAAGK